MITTTAASHSYTLLTGATGLVGRYLLRDLLSQGERLALVVRPARRGTIQRRIETILQFWETQLERELPRPLVFAGDITQPSLGLAEDDRREIGRLCNRVIHNAASLQFVGSDRAGEPWQSNLFGALHVLDFCREVGLTDFHHVSTAYVSGLREDIVMENDLDAGQAFRNDYEQSKFEAEQAIRNADFLKQLTVYRPVVISGDSQTGYTNSYHGLHLYQRYMSLLINSIEPQADGRRLAPMRIYLDGDEERNIVPVDWVSAVMTRLITTPAAWGNTYHLAPPKGMTTRALFSAAEEYFQVHGAEFVGKDAPRTERVSEWDALGHEIVSVYESYDTTDPNFDTTNLRKFAGDIPCPEVDQEMIVRYFQYGDADRWGKRREPRVEIPEEVKAGVQRWLAESDHGIHQQLGLDVCGPGGSQWTASKRSAGGWKLELGLPTAPEATMTLPAREMAELASRPLPTPAAKAAAQATAKPTRAVADRA